MRIYKTLIIITISILMTGCNSPEKEGKKYAEKICELGKKITSNSNDMGLQEQYDSLTKVITTKVLSYSPDDKVKWETGYNEGIKECGMTGGTINTGGDKYVGLWVDIHGTGLNNDTISVNKTHDNEYQIGNLKGTLTNSNNQEYITCNFDNQVEVQFIYDNTTSHLMMRSPVNNVEYKKVRDTPRTQGEEEMNSKRQETEKSKNKEMMSDSIKKLRRMYIPWKTVMFKEQLPVVLQIQKIDTTVSPEKRDSLFGTFTIGSTVTTFRTTGGLMGIFYNTDNIILPNNTGIIITVDVSGDFSERTCTGVFSYHNQDGQQMIMDVNFHK